MEVPVRRRGGLVDGLLEAAEWHARRAEALEQRALSHRVSGDTMLFQMAQFLASEHRGAEREFREGAAKADTGNWRLIDGQWVREEDLEGEPG